MTSRRGIAWAAVALPAGVLALLVIEGVIAAGGEYLPGDPGYVIDATVQPTGPVDAPEPLELLFLGDSTVAGVGSPTEAESLPVLVAQRVADRLGRVVHVRGYGASGARTRTVRLEQVPRLADERVDVTVVVVGSNDATHVTPVWEMRERTAAMLRAVVDRTQAPVVLGGIPQFKTVPALAQPLRAVVGLYAGLLREPQAAAAAAVERATYVDIAAEASPRFVGRPSSMSSDGFHPSPLGYGFWADALAPAVVEAVTSGAAASYSADS